MTVSPIKLDCQNIRLERQRINNELVYSSIVKNDLVNFNKYINTHELTRVLEELDMSKDELIDYCRKCDITNRILSGRIAKNASRQGNKDEDLQLTTCNITSSKYGIYIENLSATAYRPTKSGRIIDKKQYDKLNLKKNDCLKSFDAKIQGKINGWIFAKVVYGEGGHQDNVFEEAHTLCDWVMNHNDLIGNQYYFVLIDTDLIYKFNDLHKKYKDVPYLFIVNNLSFQNYIIKNFEQQEFE